MNHIDTLCENLISTYKKLSNKEIKQKIGFLRKEILSNREWKYLRKYRNKIQEIYQKYEFEDEIKITKNLLEGESNFDKILETYSYYKKLVIRDRNSLRACTHHSLHNNVLFIWGWPLPLTAILLATLYNIHIDVLDVDRKAYLCANKLIKKLKLDTKINIIHTNWTDYNHYDNYSIVYLASFLCYHPKDLLKIVKKISETKSCIHIIARTVSWRWELFYKPIPQWIFKHLDKVIHYPPNKEVINEVIIMNNHKISCI